MKTTLLLTSAYLALLPALFATDTYTIPEGFQTYSLVGSSSNYLSLTLTQDPVYSGTVTSVAGNTVTVATNNPLPSEVATLTAATPYFVKFLTGAQMGRIVQITAATNASSSNGGTFTIDPTDNFGAKLVDLVPLTGNVTGITPTTLFNVVTSDTFEIIPGDTLATLFGDNTAENPLALVGGKYNTSSDTIGLSLIGGTTGTGSLVYYFNTDQDHWAATSGTAATVSENSTLIVPYGDLSVRVRNGGTETFTVFGRVSQVPLLTRTVSKATVNASLKCATDETLGAIGSGLGANWTRGNSYTADAISLQASSSSSSNITVYHETTQGNWSTGSSSILQDSTTIPSGSFLQIKRTGAVSGAPAFLQSAMPYSVTN